MQCTHTHSWIILTLFLLCRKHGFTLLPYIATAYSYSTIIQIIQVIILLLRMLQPATAAATAVLFLFRFRVGLSFW